MPSDQTRKKADSESGDKHIAMWTCARSRSTMLTRSFAQLEGCVVFDEPLYPPYLLTNGFNHPHRTEIIRRYETDYETVFRKITGRLPENASFSFQKHIANNIPDELGKRLLMSVTNLFLIRHPEEIIASRWKVFGYERREFTLHEIGMADLFRFAKAFESLTGEKPLVVDSRDLLRHPPEMLRALCGRFGLKYSENMLTWNPGLRDTDPLWSETWYSTLLASGGFLPFEKKGIALPDYLKPLLEECMPFYEELFSHRFVL